MKTSKVKAVQANGTWDSPNGILYKFEYQMEDDQIVNAMHKTAEGFFKVGQEVEYEITKPEYNSGKVRKPEQGFQKGSDGGNVSKGILYQVCLKGAMDYYLSHDGGMYFTSENVNSLALEIAIKAKQNIESL
jgi:hypothetical protein